MLKKILLSFFFIVLAFLSVAFTLYNRASVELNLFVLSFELPVVLLIIFSLLIGAILGFVLAISAGVKQFYEIRRLKAQLADREQELTNLRNLPFKDAP